MFLCSRKCELKTIIFISLILLGRFCAPQIIPNELIPVLYENYKETVKSVINGSISSSRRLLKNNKHFKIHVKKLKEVNGLKRHNLLVKEEKLPQSSIIYINNPVETKIPNAYLTLEEFKKALTDRVLRAREEFKKENKLIKSPIKATKLTPTMSIPKQLLVRKSTVNLNLNLRPRKISGLTQLKSEQTRNTDNYDANTITGNIVTKKITKIINNSKSVSKDINNGTVYKPVTKPGPTKIQTSITIGVEVKVDKVTFSVTKDFNSSIERTREVYVKEAIGNNSETTTKEESTISNITETVTNPVNNDPNTTYSSPSLHIDSTIITNVSSIEDNVTNVGNEELTTNTEEESSEETEITTTTTTVIPTRSKLSRPLVFMDDNMEKPNYF